MPSLPWSWIRSLWSRGGPPPVELRGKPAIRREKAYAADSGYVYQYTYEGYRPQVRGDAAGQEYVFECTSDRASRFEVRVFAPDDAFHAWESGAGRALTQVERYAVIKMQLFEIFDEVPHLNETLDETLDDDQVERHVETLDL